MIVQLFALLIGHALADYPLQGDFIGKFKSWRVPSPLTEIVWPHLLTAHALIHAGVVWLITANPLFAALELVSHWLIDFGKCSGWYNFHQDQGLHLFTKLLYVL